MAMLDIFLTTFVTAGVLFLVLDRERMDSRRQAVGGRGSSGSSARRFGLWAGVFLGAPIATKWSGAFALAVRRGTLRDLGIHRRPARRSLVLATCLTLVALVRGRSPRRVPAELRILLLPARVRDPRLLSAAIRMLALPGAHDGVQPENSLPWSWPLLLHPIWYFIRARRARSTRSSHSGTRRCGGDSLRCCRSRCSDRPATVWQDAVVFGGYPAMFLPWFAVGRTQFIWYMLPAVPFMCLAVVADPSADCRDRSARNAGILFGGRGGRRDRFPSRLDGLARRRAGSIARVAPRLAAVDN